ncbi:MAG: hypothetical protein ACREDR_32410, partial [Blastocatellia bacterium]
IPQTVTFRLFDSVPQALLDRWRVELPPEPNHQAALDFRRRIDSYLDRGAGSAWMTRPEIASLKCWNVRAVKGFAGVRLALRNQSGPT